MSNKKQRGQQQQPLDGDKMAGEIVRRVTETAMNIVRGQSFQTNMARLMIREAAMNPGGWNNILPVELHPSHFLAQPAILPDGSVIAITNRPVQLPTCYVAMVYGEQEDHDHDHHDDMAYDRQTMEVEAAVPVGDGPTIDDGPTLDDGSEAATVEAPTFVMFKDFPGNAAANHVVYAEKHEGEEIARQLLTMNVKGVRFFYVTKLAGFESKEYLRGNA